MPKVTPLELAKVELPPGATLAVTVPLLTPKVTPFELEKLSWLTVDPLTTWLAAM